MADNFWKILRGKTGKSQFEIAVETDYTPSAVAAWESGRGSPSLRKSAKLAEAYGVSGKRIVDAIVEHKSQPAGAK